MSWGVADQIIASGSNFLTAILIARFSTVDEFGIYSMFWLVFLFTQSIQIALIVSPMMARAPKLFGEDRRHFISSVFGFQLYFIAIYFSIFFMAGLITFGGSLWMAICLVAWVTSQLMCEFARRYRYASGDNRRACLGDFFRYGTQIVIIFIIGITGNNALDLATAFLAIAAGSLVGLCVMIYGAPSPELSPGSTWILVRRQMPMSKWLLGSAMLQYLSGINLVTFLAGVLLSPTAVAALRAAQTLLGLSNILLQSIENIMQPVASRTLHEQGYSGMRRFAIRTSLLAVGGTGAISTMFAVFAPEAMGLIFGPEYVQYAYVLRWLTLSYLAISVVIATRLPLIAQEDTRPIFLSFGTGVILTVALVYPAITYFQLPGAVVLIVVAEWFVALLIGWLGWRKLGYGSS